MQKSGDLYPPLPSNALSLIEQQILDLPFLPPSFEIIPQLLLLLDDDNAGNDALVELIHVDAALTANVLHVANSALHGASIRSETLLEAVQRVGLREISRITTQIISSPVLSRAEHPGFLRLNLWQHSLTAALAAHLLAARAEISDTEVAFTAALLHDVGKVVIAHALGASYVGLIENCKKVNEPLHAAEDRLLQINHAAVGATLLEHWDFPVRIVSTIRAQHSPCSASSELAPLAAVLYTANLLAYRSGNGYGFPDYAVHPDPEILAMARRQPEELRELEALVRQALDREQSAFRS